MNPVEVDLSNFLDAEDKATRRHNCWHKSELDDLVDDVMTGNSERLTLADILDGVDPRDYAGKLINVCNSSGDDLITAREELDSWLNELVRSYCEESEELDRRILERDESERNGNV